MPAYRNCPDDGIVAYDWPQHLIFHDRLALQVAQLVTLTQQVIGMGQQMAALTQHVSTLGQQVGALSQQVATLSERVTVLETPTEEPA